jgi:hypothetical protein
MRFQITSLVLTLLVWGAADAQLIRAAAKADIAESFKQFVSSPPAFQVVAEVCNKTPESNDFSCVFALVRFQTNGFYYREAPSLIDLSSQSAVYPKYRWAGRYGNEYWDFSADGLTLSMATNADVRMREVVELVEAIHASKILHLGIFGSLPGSIQWEDGKIRQYTNKFGVAVEGELLISPAGVPQRINLTTTREANRVPWEFNYEYSTTRSLPDYLPSKISGSSLRLGQRELSFEIRLIEVKLADGLFPREYFMPGPITNRVPHQILETSSGAVFRDKLHPAWTPVNQPQDSSPLRKFWVIAALVSANGVLIFALIVRSWRRGATTKP